MQFIIVYSLKPENRQAAVVRFKETQGAPPAEVEMLGRWHSAAMHEGFILAEADDVVAVATWCHRWADRLSFRIVPVLSDDQLTTVLAS